MNKTIMIAIPALFSIHWCSIQLYVNWCAPPGWSGFYQSIITSPSPICIALNHIQYYAIHYYYSIWLMVGLVGLSMFQQQASRLVSENRYDVKTKLTDMNPSLHTSAKPRTRSHTK